MKDEHKICAPHELLDYIEAGNKIINTEKAIRGYKKNRMKRYLIQLRTKTTMSHNSRLYIYEAQNLEELKKRIDNSMFQDFIEILAVEEIDD